MRRAMLAAEIAGRHARHASNAPPAAAETMTRKATQRPVTPRWSHWSSPRNAIRQMSASAPPPRR